MACFRNKNTLVKGSIPLTANDLYARGRMLKYSVQKATGSVPGTSAVSARTAVIAMFLLLGLALILRCFMLSKQSLWLDEFLTWDAASGDLARAIQADYAHPPLHYVLTHFWIQLFGTSEAALRSVNVIPSVLSVWLVYLLGKRLFSVEIALIAALYQSISSFQIYYAQEARTYAFLVFFLLIAALALWNALEEEIVRRRWLWYACYAVAVTLALYSHFITVFFLAGHGLFVLLRRPRRVFEFSAAAIVAVAMFGPWLVAMLQAAAKGGQPFRHFLFLKLPQAYFSFFFGDSLIPLDSQAVGNIGATLRAGLPILLTGIVCLAIFTAFGWLAWKRWKDAMLFVLAIATLPVILAFLVSFKMMLFDERYLVGSSPFLYLAIAAAIWEIVLWPAERPGSVWQPRIGWAAVAAYAVLLLISLYHYYFVDRFGKDQWREAVAYVESPGTNDFVILEPDFAHYCYDYYQKRNLHTLAVTQPVWDEIIASPESLSRRVQGFDRLWLVQNLNSDEKLQIAIQKQFPQLTHREFPRANGIYVDSFAIPRK